GGAAWPTWRGFAKLWSQLAMWAAPPGLAADRHLEARRLRAGTLVRLETVADGAGPFVLRVPEVGEVVLRPTGRRAFGAIVPALEAGVHPAVLAAGGHEEPVEIIVPARSVSGRELRAGRVRQLRRDSAPEADRPDGRPPGRRGRRARRTAREAPRARCRRRSSAP